mgnify:FL=1
MKVDEVENRFVVPALLKIMQEQLGLDESDLAKAEEFIKELFVAKKPAQIREAIKKELEHQLDCLIFDKQSTTTDDFTREINSNILDKINEIIAEKTAIFDGADSLDEILKVLNFKRLSTIIGDQYKLKVGEYPRRVINLLKNNPNDIKGRIIEAVKPYLPVLPDAEDIEAENNNEQECEVVEN